MSASPPALGELLKGLLRGLLGLILRTLLNRCISKLHDDYSAPGNLYPSALSRVRLLLARLLIRFHDVLTTVGVEGFRFQNLRDLHDTTTRLFRHGIRAVLVPPLIRLLVINVTFLTRPFRTI